MQPEEKNLFDLVNIFINGNDDERASVTNLFLEALAKTDDAVEYQDGKKYPALVDGFAIKTGNDLIGIEITVYRMPESDN